MRGLNLKEIMSKSNMNQQGLNIATYGQAYERLWVLTRFEHGYQAYYEDSTWRTKWLEIDRKKFAL